MQSFWFTTKTQKEMNCLDFFKKIVTIILIALTLLIRDVFIHRHTTYLESVTNAGMVGALVTLPKI